MPVHYSSFALLHPVTDSEKGPLDITPLPGTGTCSPVVEASQCQWASTRFWRFQSSGCFGTVAPYLEAFLHHVACMFVLPKLQHLMRFQLEDNHSVSTGLGWKERRRNHRKTLKEHTRLVVFGCLMSILRLERGCTPHSRCSCLTQLAQVLKHDQFWSNWYQMDTSSYWVDAKRCKTTWIYSYTAYCIMYMTYFIVDIIRYYNELLQIIVRYFQAAELFTSYVPGCHALRCAGWPQRLSTDWMTPDHDLKFLSWASHIVAIRISRELPDASLEIACDRSTDLLFVACVVCSWFSLHLSETRHLVFDMQSDAGEVAAKNLTQHPLQALRSAMPWRFPQSTIIESSKINLKPFHVPLIISDPQRSRKINSGKPCSKRRWMMRHP